MSSHNGSPHGLASVIVPCFNQIEFTRQCVTALARHTRPPWKLIAVDDRSTDGTREYLASVKRSAPFPVEILRNETNRGFPGSCNLGLAAAPGEHLVLLNNDAVVTNGWLDMLVALVESSPSLGLTGPMSNYAAPPQLIEHVPYTDLESMEHYANRWRDEHRGQWFAVDRLSGFCLLLKRAVYERIGGFDESFGRGYFEDTDLCVRARHAGFTLAVAHDLFVHHDGSRSFTAAGLDTESLLRENQERFHAKWGDAVPRGRPVSLRPWKRSGPPRGAKGKPTVSATLIVRDEEKNLPACLASVQGLFDEIVVIDTGSRDRTIEIARSFGARVCDFPLGQ